MDELHEHPVRYSSTQPAIFDNQNPTSDSSELPKSNLGQQRVACVITLPISTHATSLLVYGNNEGFTARSVLFKKSRGMAVTFTKQPNACST